MLEKSDISQGILDYLRDHPQASDTLEGITEWWLLNQRIRFEMEKVKAAVSELVKEGWVIENKSSNATVHYRLNPKKRVWVKSARSASRSDFLRRGEKQ